MARDTITIRRPPVGERLKLGSRVGVSIDLSLAHPWFEAPAYGSHIRTITGQSRRGLDFQLTSERPVLSATEGRAVVFDTRKDCYTRTDTTGAGLGCHVVVTSGDLKLTYANLKRGSARSGSVKPGDRLGYAGNTGHCLDGDRRYFVHFEVYQASTPREPDAFEDPLEVVLQVEGRPIDRPVRVPEGAIEVEGFDAGDWSIEPREYRLGPCELEVVLKQGNRVRASTRRKVDIVR
jgi:murein DD-endopeptidase MepM/ murein hydrolase activator NlpD